jgi:metal-dependent amidase/aminoacylase/carboxypeptidase family protein
MQYTLITEIHTSAHASASPWDGQNALDAAVLAYSSISTLRQQIKVLRIP